MMYYDNRFILFLIVFSVSFILLEDQRLPEEVLVKKEEEEKTFSEF